ncbi:energy transducer TonB [Desulfofustis glycolicus]|uniref:Outer membrane transport energization protein TonB n=1 Tax=Desulfofustis glycolicus DSM 9705 TaxID=1121409 RepID=A0A1M5X1E0_9BACT|nr:energy transducer TonB [Desulfofustis glycolicus]MCB2215551.1 energy transducer TonB [Desulfobulbaceae bacterium]SHH93601.1 outer membrane transport energization protein TonB [Desulfofustis glycolicus DSM 9705]
MKQSRLTVALTCALAIHVFIFTIHLPAPSVSPRLISSDSITVTLAVPSVAKDEEHREHVREQKPPLRNERNTTERNENHTIGKQENHRPPPESVEEAVNISPDARKKIFRSRTETNRAQKTTPDLEHEKNRSQEGPVMGSQQKMETSSSRSLQVSAASVVEALPLYEHNPKPIYPEIARRRKWEGIVILEAGVDSNGNVVSSSIHQSSGYPVLDDSAHRAVRKWRFIPANRNGVPIACTIMIPVAFALEGTH